MISKHTTVAFSIIVATFLVACTAVAATSPVTDATVARSTVNPGTSKALHKAPSITDGPIEVTVTTPKPSNSGKVVTIHRKAQAPKKVTAWRCWQTPLDTTLNGTVTRCEVVEI